MPIVPYTLLNCVFYLYKSKAAALAGEDAGGTGFLVSMKSGDGIGHHYAVSNYHVAVSRGYSCIRFNTVNGGTEAFDFGPEEWLFEPGKDDVAILPLDLKVEGLMLTFIQTNLLLHPPAAIQEQIGPGDDVFMVGRFVDIDARQMNIPSLRFGHISTLPVPVEQPNGYKGPCYCVDMHSRTGFSGSPVFVYRTPGNTLEWAVTGGPINLGAKSVLALLGIHCGQFPEEMLIKKRKRPAIARESSKPQRMHEEYVQGMSGMTCVIPAWKIGDLLERIDFVKRREDVEAMRAKTDGPTPKRPVEEAASSQGNAAKVRDEILETVLATPPQPRRPRGNRRPREGA